MFTKATQRGRSGKLAVSEANIVASWRRGRREARRNSRL